jgi:hypothetical protein
MKERESTSFCGLWCGDCIPSNERLFALAAELSQFLKDINFELYAKYKSRKVPELQHYDEFIEVLNAIEKLHCYNHCYLGPISCAGCASDCKIRTCVLENGFEGCWQCLNFETCPNINGMKRMHPNIIENLLAIQTYGIENWSQHRAKHYDFSFLL